MKADVAQAGVKQAAFLIRIESIASHEWRGELRCLSLGETFEFSSLAELLHLIESEMNRLEYPPEAWSKRSWLHVDERHRSAAASRQSR